jgi:hypothetical protein
LLYDDKVAPHFTARGGKAFVTMYQDTLRRRTKNSLSYTMEQDKLEVATENLDVGLYQTAYDNGHLQPQTELASGM